MSRLRPQAIEGCQESGRAQDLNLDLTATNSWLRRIQPPARHAPAEFMSALCAAQQAGSADVRGRLPMSDKVAFILVVILLSER